MQKLTPAKIKNLLVKILKEHKAIDVKSLNVSKLTDIADYMIIATANSTTHTRALIAKSYATLVSSKVMPLSIEEDRNREWVLADFGSVILHVMVASIRKFYELEKLWGVDKIIKSKMQLQEQ